jgi:hypothetical protein
VIVPILQFVNVAVEIDQDDMKRAKPRRALDVVQLARPGNGSEATALRNASNPCIIHQKQTGGRTRGYGRCAVGSRSVRRKKSLNARFPDPPSLYAPFLGA